MLTITDALLFLANQLLCTCVILVIDQNVCRERRGKDEQVDWGEGDLRVSSFGATGVSDTPARRASTHVVLLKFKGDGGEPRAVGGGRQEGSRDRGRAANVCSRHTIPYYCSRECQVARFALAARQLVHM